MAEVEMKTAPMWQRVFFGVLGFPGIAMAIVMFATLVRDGKPVWDVLAVFALPFFGVLLFAFIAVKGKLPRIFGQR